MTSFDREDDDLDRLLQAPHLNVPADFVQRVMAALPDQREAIAPEPAPRPALQWLQAAVALLFGGLGAVQVLLFVGGLWIAWSPASG